MSLSSPSLIRNVLEEMGVAPRKSRGQNFLYNPGSIEKIINFAQIEAGKDTVLELGPGLGALTEGLLTVAKNYYLIELEGKFAQYLKANISGLNDRNVFIEDGREFSIEKKIPQAFLPLIFVSNVPYSISSDVVLWIIKNRKYIKRASLLLQREFAERIAANSGTKEYGSLSVLTKLYADIALGPIISGGSFFPQAEVESRMLELKILNQPRFDVEQKIFEKVVRSSFGKRRKTILNSLAASKLFGEKSDIEQWLLQAGIFPGSRAEDLELADFAKLVGNIDLRSLADKIK